MTADTGELTHLRLERPSDGVVLLTLDNPDQRNAMSDEMTASWVRAVDQLAGDRSVRAVVVTGEGSAFTSGGQLDWLASEPDASVDALRDRMLPFYRAWLSIRRLEVPTIAAVNGPAIGAGLCLALACDMRCSRSKAPRWASPSPSSACTRAWPAPSSCPRWSATPPPATSS
ncbi:enoyl-CoA hydratase/isomerase family protein [Nocardioides daphniae]|uniref:enoyl-CoA hydratase/isomerase family protein n=1 Tax=Nocardioides daphniae TaxID=402297 RepID=UPI001930F8BA|nr:enoyl-CoA hydratase/isomerase family protein [Nocardioides daphniae]